MSVAFDRQSPWGDTPTMEAIFARVREAFHDPKSPRYRLVEGVIWGLILLSCVLLVVDLALGSESQSHRWLVRIDHFVLGVFAIEIILRVLTYRPPALDFFSVSKTTRMWTHVVGRLRFCLRPSQLIDIFTVLALFPVLRGLRALRLLRLVHSPRWFPYSNPIGSIIGAFRDNGLLFGFAFSALGFSTMLGGVTFYFIERHAPGTKIDSLGDGLWWAIVTLTTVGFGDITPATDLGRVVASVLMIAGMFTLAMFAGIIGHTLLRSLLRIREEQFRMSNYINHLVICGYNPGARMLLDEVLLEHDPSDTDLVIFAPGERPAEVPPVFFWVTGDPTKESELAKARLTHARAILVVGKREIEPQAADAITILTVFTIRAHLKKQSETEARLAPLYVVAEILEEENVDHVRAAGADEVIESTRLGFSLMSHAVAMPGTSEVMSRVATVGAHSLYMAPLPPSYELPLSFGQLARRLKTDTGALAIGLHDSSADVGHINPDAEHPVSSEHSVIYLAESPVDIE